MTDENSSSTPPALHKRRVRYGGKNPRQFEQKYKELNPERYGADVAKIIASGKTPAGMHRPIMVAEILAVLAPQPGEVAVDATLGYGGHARAILEKLPPGGRLLGLDVDPLELPRTQERLRAAGFEAAIFTAHRSNFAGLRPLLDREGIAGADLILADLGVSSMQLDNPARGFTYRASGPLDMRMNPARGEPASQFLSHVTEEKLLRLLEENADEPHARFIAAALKKQLVTTTAQLCDLLRAAFTKERPYVIKSEVELSLRRTFQALRIAVNDEFSALDTFLRHLPACLKSGGRVAILTFHSGEDRRVKKAFQTGQREGIYTSIAEEVTRASAEELRANPRASSAKLRWAVRA